MLSAQSRLAPPPPGCFQVDSGGPMPRTANMVAKSAFTMTSNGSPQYTSLYGHRNDLDQFVIRAKTYVFAPKWAKSRSKEFAESGFYYTGNENELKCFKCSKVLDESSSKADLRLIHDCTKSEQLGSESDDNSSDEDDISVDGAHRSPGIRPAVRVENTTSLNSSKKMNVRTNIDKESLRQENERLRLAMTCCKCNKERIQTLFLPCRHLVSCEACAEKMDNCIRCNQKILGTVRTYMV